MRVEEGSWLLKPTPSWKGSVALMMVWATVSPFLQVSVPPQYLQHIYTQHCIYIISTPYLHYIYTVSTHLSTLAMAGVVGVTQLEVNSPLLLPPCQSDSIDIVYTSTGWTKKKRDLEKNSP